MVRDDADLFDVLAREAPGIGRPWGWRWPRADRAWAYDADDVRELLAVRAREPHVGAHEQPIVYGGLGAVVAPCPDCEPYPGKLCALHRLYGGRR
jgi:hypothetical protein